MNSRYGLDRPLCTNCARRDSLKQSKGTCSICKGIFNRISGSLKQLRTKTREIDFTTFSVSSRIPREIELAEEELWDRTGISNVLSLKTDLNRRLAAAIERDMGKRFERDSPDVMLLFDFTTNEVTLSPQSLYIYGHYMKFSRELAQTRWPCYCKDGCDLCGGTKRKHLSVEDLVSEPLLKAFDAKHSKFHGAGREDIDARMLGEGRPFVFELESPKKRNLDLQKLQSELNARLKGRVEISRMRFTSQVMVETIKRARPEKSYSALVETSEQISEELLTRIPAHATLHQKTPQRVLHRRADLERIRRVKGIRCKLLTKNTFQISMDTEAGTYVKEFISGDGGRTRPSINHFIGTDAVCKELDVTGIQHSFLSDYW
ncbi:MAG: tRNA pseudouridine(54/55) synthase Pus10 [Candidatus Micrarchaeota archaeon]